MNVQKMMVYTLSNCPHCIELKKFVDDNGLEVEYIHVDQLDWKETEAVLLELEKICPDCGFPITIIGENVIEDFNPKAIKEALGI